MIRYNFLVSHSIPILLALNSFGIANAGPGGYIPGPGMCDYPGIGSSGQIAGGEWYYCDFPTEINSSHWHCEYGGYSLAGGGIATQNFGGFVAPNILGAVGGACSWRWPDNTPAIAPNPPGAWKTIMVVKSLPPVEHRGAPQPYDQTLPPGTNPAEMPPLPPPLGPEPPPPPPEPLGPVTNPVPPNPLITQNPQL